MIEILAGGMSNAGGASKALLKCINVEHHCGGEIAKDFLEESVENADILIVSTDTNKHGKRGSCRGFACLQIRRSSFYIDLICVGKSHKMTTRSKRKNDTGKDIINTIKTLTSYYLPSK